MQWELKHLADGMGHVNVEVLRLLGRAWQRLVDVESNVIPNTLNVSRQLHDHDWVHATTAKGKQWDPIALSVMHDSRPDGPGLTLAAVADPFGSRPKFKGDGIPVLTIGVNANGRIIVRQSDVDRGNPDVTIDGEMDGYGLLALAGVNRVQCVADSNGAALITDIESDGLNVRVNVSREDAEKAARGLGQRTLECPRNSDAVAMQLLAALGAQVILDGLEVAQGQTVEVTYHPFDNERNEPTLRVDDDSWSVSPHDRSKWYMGRREHDSPAFRTALQIAAEHGFDDAYASDVSVSFSQNRPQEEIDDFLSDLRSAGWDCDVHGTALKHGEKDVLLTWRGRMWSWSKINADGSLGDRMPATSERDAHERIRVDGKGKGVIHHVTRTPGDGRFMELHSAGNGYRHDLGEAMRSTIMERPGMVR